MSDFRINASWILLNIIVCKLKSISRTVFEKWELEKCCVRSVIQCICALWSHITLARELAGFIVSKPPNKPNTGPYRKFSVDSGK